MEFKFSCPDENVTEALAFAIDKDDNIQITYGNNPINTNTMAHILGAAIRDTLKNDGTNNDYVDKRDEIHKVARIFADALGCDLLAANWRKPKDELPCDEGDVLFVLRWQDQHETPHRGYYDHCGNVFREDFGDGYHVDDVAYWMPCPNVPIQKRGMAND